MPDAMTLEIGGIDNQSLGLIVDILDFRGQFREDIGHSIALASLFDSPFRCLSQDDAERILAQLLLLSLCESADSEEAKHRYPLKSAEVRVVEETARSGCYRAIVRIEPHNMFKEFNFSMRLIQNAPLDQ